MGTFKAAGMTVLTVLAGLALLKVASKYVGPVGKARDFILK